MTQEQQMAADPQAPAPRQAGLPRSGCWERSAEAAHPTRKDSRGCSPCPQSPSEEGPCRFFLHKVAGASEHASAPLTPSSMDYGLCPEQGWGEGGCAWQGHSPCVCVWWWWWGGRGGDVEGLRAMYKSPFKEAEKKVSFHLLTLPKSPHHQLRAHRHLLRTGTAKAFLTHDGNTGSPVFLRTSYTISVDPTN